MTLKRKIRHGFKVSAYIALSLVVLFTLSVLARIAFNPSAVRAGNAVFYPKFCLGGWDHPQKASNDPELDSSSPASAYSISNSAYLASGVSAQIFCGYFSTEDKTNAPSAVTIAFQWNMQSVQATAPAPTQTLVVPEIASTTIQQTVQYDNIGPSTITLTEVGTSTQPAVITTPDATTSTDTSTTPPAPEPTPEATSSGETSFIQKFLTLVTTEAYAQSGGQTFSSSPLFEVSYSVDGIRWNSVGTVGQDNWQGYTVQIPVKTWDELNRLQLTVSPVPSIDKRPDVYLESIAARVTYDRTLGESAADAVDAVTNVVDVVAETLTNIPVINQIIPVPQKIFITKKKLTFSLNSRPDDVLIDLNSSGSSLILAGSCSKKYFVVLVYADERDFQDNPASFVANEARDCNDGGFSYDLASLSPEIKSGTYYVLMGEEGKTGPWTPVGRPFPVNITATSTVEEIIQ